MNPDAFFYQIKSQRRLKNINRLTEKVYPKDGQSSIAGANEGKRYIDHPDAEAVKYKGDQRFSSGTESKISRVHKSLLRHE